MCKQQQEQQAEEAEASCTPSSSSSSSSALPWPEDTANIWQKWTYHYMGDVLSQSFARNRRHQHQQQQGNGDDILLTHDDIYAVPDRLASQHLRRAFWKEYHQQLAATAQLQQSHQKKRNPHQRALCRTLWKLAAPTFVPAGACQFVSIVAQVVTPLLVHSLLQHVEKQHAAAAASSTYNIPLWPCFGILVALLVYGLTNHRQRHLAMQAGITIRAVVLVVLYERVLTLTTAGRAGITTGYLSNLVATDAQKLYEVAQEGHLLWALPKAIALVTACLLVVMGPVTLVGIAVLVALVPLVHRISASMLKLRTERVACTDQRVALTHALLQGMQVTKLNHYENSYQKAITAIRQAELKFLERETAVWATTLSVSKLSAAFAAAATFTVYVLVDSSHVLTAATSFSVFLLFAALRFPINYAGRFVGRLAQAQSSVQRLAAFLERPATELNDDDGANEAQFLKQQDITSEEENQAKTSTVSNPPPSPLIVRKGSFAVGESIRSTATTEDRNASLTQAGEKDPSSSFVVSGFDFEVRKGQVLACCGPVGSGKSTLIQGILGEALPASSDTVVKTNGSVALVPQTPFILNDTVRENILFGRPYNSMVYQQVIQACCLGPDIASLGPTRDLTEIGERGVTLSGGQKQRLSLARAAYGKPDLILLDDPLSALDAGTAKRVFQNLIKGPEAFLAESAIILVTHASHFLNQVDIIAVIVEGQSKFIGTWHDLLAFEAADDATKRAVDHIRESIQEDHHGEESQEEGDCESGSNDAEEKDALMTKEEREHGLSSWTTWLLWFKYAGGFYFVCIMVFLLTIDRILYFGQEYWVARWTDGAYEPITIFGISFAPQTDGRSAQYNYLAAYAVILALALCANLARSEWGVTGGSRAARNVFQAMLSRVLRAPMSYFETTPMGRLLNRFTYDMEVVDFVLSQNMSLLLVATASYVSGVTVMIGILPIVAASAIPVTIIYVCLLWYYRKTGTDLQRLDALARSPIQAMMTEGMDGVTTIRVLKRESVFLEKYHHVVDKSTSALLNFVSAQRWLGFRIETMAAITVFVPALLVSCWNDHMGLSSGLAGLLIVGSLNFTLALSFLVDYFAEAESAITAIERVDAMSKVPQEKQTETDPKLALDPSWPTCGKLEFKNVCMRYRPGLPLALNGLSFEIPPGKTCGVVGRTGAGKSSLTVALFRLVEIESGSISLDDINLGTLGLSDVRGRANGMSIIPQDPFLAGATIRECLDPFHQSNDPAILDALEAVRLRQPHGTSPGLGLDTAIEEGGRNLSVGERQLLNLARALLSQPKLLVLDEATASIDGALDALIQHMLRTRFPGTTLLTIAHRLHTIMDNDFVLVMHDGKAAEFGAPCDLLEMEGGLFSELVDATGLESSKALRNMPKKSDEGCWGVRTKASRL